MNKLLVFRRTTKPTTSCLTLLRTESDAPACVSYLVQSDIIAPVKARAGQIITCNPRSSLQALTVIVKEQGGRIVGTLTRTAVVDAFQQLEALAACGVLSTVTQDAIEVRA